MEEGSAMNSDQEADHRILDTSGSEASKTKGDEIVTNDEDLIATQGIFAHTTSLEDSITDEVGALDLHRTTNEQDDTGRGSIMRSSIHELQGDDDTISQLSGDSKKTPVKSCVELDER